MAISLIFVVIILIVFALATFSSASASKKPMEQKAEHIQAPKIAFFYMLSLVALILMSLSTGIVIFQFINKYVRDIFAQFPDQFDRGALRFAISAILVATPIYYTMMRLIRKNLLAGLLDKDSPIRKWLTYFILLVASVVSIGWLIGTINSFFSGELTLKAILKAATAIGISAAVFAYYLIDIRRPIAKGERDNFTRIYFYASLATVLAVFIAGVMLESPGQARERRFDELVTTRLSTIENNINQYYQNNGRLPEKLDIMLNNTTYFLQSTDLVDPETGQPLEYRIKEKDSFELCALFKLSNRGEQNPYYGSNWEHDAGRQCFERKIDLVKGAVPAPVK